MANYWQHQNDTEIIIPTSEEINGATYYNITVKIANIYWRVQHRYSEFFRLHNDLINDHGVAKDMLPPKKIYNKCPTFIEERRKALELYMQYVFYYLRRTMPRTFISFLNIDEYDTFFMLPNLAFEFFQKGDELLLLNKSYSFHVLQLHAISKTFKAPLPAVEETDKRYDISNILDVCTQLLQMKLTGSSEPYKESNIIPNNLSIDFLSFKSVQTLEVTGISFANIYSVGTLRSTLKNLIVRNTSVTNISQILLCDTVHKATATDNEVWNGIENMDLSFNNIITIDDSMKLVPNLRSLTINQNKISDITNLSYLTKLSELDLSINLISNCDSLHTKLGNVVQINLSYNSISSLRGFEKLYSLENLDLSCNQINDMEEFKYIGGLPCLESLRLVGNPVAIVVDYRVKVLEKFGSRAADIYLDNEKATQKELDTANLLQALRIVKEGKTPDLCRDKFQ